MFTRDMNIADFDPELYQAMSNEVVRQEEHIELIASENYCSPRVLEAQGSQLTNKYAEGYPGNVQPHAGSQANAAVFQALVTPGGKVLGMSLAHGGHLTHGSHVNFSGKSYEAIQYGLHPETGDIDYVELERLALEHKPEMIIGGFSAFSGVVDWARMREIADKVDAYFFVDMAHVAGLVAAGLYPNPVPHAHVVSTTTHKTLAGPRGGLIVSGCNDEAIYKKLNSAVFPGGQGGPLMHIIAAKAVAFKEALSPEFKTYQQNVLDNAKAMVAVLQERGYKVVSNGTENHLLLLDLIDKDITGKDADAALGRAHITVNKNSVPNDPRSPFVTSGLRLGTPAITRRGFGIEETKAITTFVCDILDDITNEETIVKVQAGIKELCTRFPVYK
jgi:glycine hydroxymethyltransferase